MKEEVGARGVHVVNARCKVELEAHAGWLDGWVPQIMMRANASALGPHNTVGRGNPVRSTSDSVSPHSKVQYAGYHSYSKVG